MGRSQYFLPFAPRPCPGEILSSWLSRVACRYDISAETLIASLLFPHERMWRNAPVDWGLSDQNLKDLADIARLDVGSVIELDIRSRFPTRDRHCFTWTHVYPDQLKHTGDQYSDELAWIWCSECLAAGFEATGQDYIRRDWISAYAGYCQVHRRPLTDVCACGVSRGIVHLSEGAAAKLYCRACRRRLADARSAVAWDAGRYPDAVDLQLAFEHDLASALNGLRSVRWCGSASSDALLAIVDDVVHALCTRAGYDPYVPIDDFGCLARIKRRFPHIPDTEHKLCSLRPFWRWRAIAATLAVIGDEETCAVMSRQREAMEDPLLHSFQDWRGSLEWLLSQLTPSAIDQLGRKSKSWPRKVRERFFLATAQQ